MYAAVKNSGETWQALAMQLGSSSTTLRTTVQARAKERGDKPLKVLVSVEVESEKNLPRIYEMHLSFCEGVERAGVSASEVGYSDELPVEHGPGQHVGEFKGVQGEQVVQETPYT